MKSESLIMEPIKLPIDPKQIIINGWDGFGEIAGTVISQIPWPLWIVIGIVTLVRLGAVIPELGKWSLRYVLRSSFLD